MALQLAAAQSEAIRRHGEKDYPNECCGLLLGRFEGEHRIVAEVYPMRNANTASPVNRFDFDPREHLAAQRRARERGLEVVGFYHSHPNHPARPSQYDLEHAAWPGYSYVIVRVQQGQAQDLNSYELADDRSHFIQEPVADGAPAGRPPA